MMIEEGLRSFLVALATDAAERVYPIRLPQGVTLPAVTYQKIAGVRVHDHGGVAGLAEPRFDVHCWDRSYLLCKGLATQVREGIDGFRGTFLMGGEQLTVRGVMLQNEIDLFEPETELHHTVLDFTIGHRE